MDRVDSAPAVGGDAPRRDRPVVGSAWVSLGRDPRRGSRSASLWLPSAGAFSSGRQPVIELRLNRRQPLKLNFGDPAEINDLLKEFLNYLRRDAGRRDVVSGQWLYAPGTLEAEPNGVRRTVAEAKSAADAFAHPGCDVEGCSPLARWWIRWLPQRR